MLNWLNWLTSNYPYSTILLVPILLIIIGLLVWELMKARKTSDMLFQSRKEYIAEMENTIIRANKGDEEVRKLSDKLRIKEMEAKTLLIPADWQLVSATQLCGRIYCFVTRMSASYTPQILRIVGVVTVTIIETRTDWTPYIEPLAQEFEVAGRAIGITVDETGSVGFLTHPDEKKNNPEQAVLVYEQGQLIKVGKITHT